MQFFVGLHHPHTARHFERCLINVPVLRRRRSPFPVADWILDSGGFQEVTKHGRYRHSAEDYAATVRRWSDNGRLLAAVAQDFMCEPVALAATGLTIPDHQRLTIERFDELVACDTGGVYVMPVLQGYQPSEYVAHVEQYGARLALGAWVGVGSVCKRNGKPREIEDVLLAIRRVRPDLRLHGFGLKKTALGSGIVLSVLATADSHAWSARERWAKSGRQNDWRKAKDYVDAVERIEPGSFQWRFPLARAA